jgi:transposase
MAALSIADVSANVTVGVDTHKHSHLARAKDGLGRHLGQLEIETNPHGYADLLDWAQGFGSVLTFGIEGTSNYGAGLTRFLRARGQVVIEVLRPARRDRRFGGKSDPIDADAAAGAVQSGRATATPKAGDAGIELVRAVKIAKQTAIKARTQAVNAVKGLIVMAPDPIREQLRHLSTPNLVRTCSAYRVDGASDPASATKLSLRSLCRRYVVLDQEVRSLEKELDTLTQRTVPQLRRLFGVGQAWPRPWCWLLATGGIGSAPKPRSRCCAVRRRFRLRRAWCSVAGKWPGFWPVVVIEKVAVRKLDFRSPRAH